MYFKVSKRIQKINADIDNVALYQLANFQLKIPYNPGCAKMIKSSVYNNGRCKL
jgi:hypothetical protein